MSSITGNVSATAVNGTVNRGSCKYPKLTAEEKAAMKALMDKWYDNRKNFVYEYKHSIDIHSYGYCYDTSAKKFKLNCATFVQMIMMGRKVEDYLGKDNTNYDPTIHTAFDFGYYFKFLDRKYAYGLLKPVTDEDTPPYYGWTNPNEDKTDLRGSYSYNTYYSPEGGQPFSQSFNGFNFANDMAKELCEMGCEIPLSELEQGDILFFTDIDPYDDHSAFNKVAWRNITHVGMVYRVKDDGELSIIDCANSTLTILRRGRSYPEKEDVVPAVGLMSKLVMCARMPIAFGYESNVPSRIDKCETPTPSGA